MKWITVNVEVAYKRVINCTNTVELRSIWEYLYMTHLYVVYFTRFIQKLKLCSME
jgi:hypothetical protein